VRGGRSGQLRSGSLLNQIKKGWDQFETSENQGGESKGLLGIGLIGNTMIC
jgi:hypothetical protein